MPIGCTVQCQRRLVLILVSMGNDIILVAANLYVVLLFCRQHEYMAK